MTSTQMEEAVPSEKDVEDATEQNNVSAQSKNISDLLKTRDWLRSQILEYKTRLEAGNKDMSTMADDPEILLSNLGELKGELQKAHCDKVLHDLILKRLEQSNLLGKFLIPAEEPAAGDAPKKLEHEEQRLLKELILEQNALSCEVLKQHKVNREKKQKNAELRRENIDLMHKIRELVDNNERERESQESRLRESINDEDLVSAEAKLEKLTQMTELARLTFQGLILGSGVNWMEDPDLSKILLSLGRPLDEVLANR